MLLLLLPKMPLLRGGRCSSGCRRSIISFPEAVLGAAVLYGGSLLLPPAELAAVPDSLSTVEAWRPSLLALLSPPPKRSPLSDRSVSEWLLELSCRLSLTHGISGKYFCVYPITLKDFFLK